MEKSTGTEKMLKWVQPRLRNRHFELRSGDEVIATLTWEKTFGTLATAQAADRTWTFKRVGIFNPRVTVRSPGSEADIAMFKPSWSYSGTLDLQGRTYAWKQLGLLGGKWGFAGHDGTMLLTFKYESGLDNLLKLEGEVEVTPGQPANPDLPLLITLGWYIMVMMADDMAAVAAAASVM